MSFGSFWRHVCRYFDRRHIDWSLKNGTIVHARNWPEPVEIIDINWALLAAAVRLGPGDAIMVWPISSLRRVSPLCR